MDESDGPPVPRVFPRREKRRLLPFGLLGLLLCCAFPGTASLPVRDKDAKTSLHGLVLHVTLPYARYGPSQPVRVYLTFLNRGPLAVAFRGDGPVTVAATVEGRRVLLPSEEEKKAGDGKKTPGSLVTLRPGERWTRVVTASLDRKLFLPGDYPLRVACDLPSTGSPSREGSRARRLAGTLLSNEVRLVVRYAVILVY